MQYKPAIVVVAYNRYAALKRLLSYVNQADYPDNDVTLIISIDYSLTNQDVIELAEEFQWNHGVKIVKTHVENLGLKEHILECGNYAFKYGTVIILEDDLVVAPSFYKYIQTAQNFYDKNDNIAGVSPYAYEWNGYARKKFVPLKKDGDVYFGQFACSLGQSWTKKQWKNFREWYESSNQLILDGKMPDSIYTWDHSWSKYFTAYIVETDKYFVIPYEATVSVFGDIGVHARSRYLEHQVTLYLGNKMFEMVEFEKGVHYDSFFENIDLKFILGKRLNLEDVCIDFYAHRKIEFIKSRYILSTRRLNKKIIKAYALDMRPQEINIIFNVEGQDVFLYDMNINEKNKIYKKKNRIMYDLSGVRPRIAMYYAFYKGVEERINARRKQKN